MQREHARLARVSTRQTFDVAAVRRRFSSLDRGFAFLDAPGGTQVPDEVGAAIATALAEASANLGAPYATSRRVGETLAEAEHAAARLLGGRPEEITFGANMTSLNFTLSRTAARGFAPGDEVLVTELDHDGGVAPWLELAEDRGLVVKTVGVRDDLTLDLDDLERQITDRTRVVAFAWAANSVGSIADAERICALAHSVGALAWIDAVHFAAHEVVDVAAVGADVLLCSPYKFCGPHLGIAYVREEVARRWRPYKVRPAPDEPTGRRFLTGTLPFELLAGFVATTRYLDDLGGLPVLREYERELGARFLDGLPDGVTVHGRPDMEGRVPTFLVTVDGVAPRALAERLAERGYGVWAHHNWYAVGLEPHLPPGGSVRIGFIHYNTAEEVDGLLGELAAAAAGA